jgi:hypothetical protein
MSNSIQVDAVAQVLIEKGVFTEQEFYAKLKEVQYEYESRPGAKVQIQAPVFYERGKVLIRI